MYDSDNSGDITIEELRHFIGDHSITEEAWGNLFNSIDFNQDGKIDIEDFKTLMLKHK